MDNKYQNEKVYSISTVNRDKVYVGSTTKKLSDRIVSHEHDYKHWLYRKGNYTSSFEIIEPGNYIIDLLENYPCSIKQELHSKEQEWIEKTANCVNKNKAFTGLTRKDYMKDYKKIELATKIDCECGGKTDLNNKYHHKKSLKHQAYLNQLQQQ